MAKDFWTKRDLFRQWVGEAKAMMLNGTNADVAAVMGLSPQSLKKYISPNATHKPGDEALGKLGDFLKRDYRLLLDDPRVAPVGISQASWATNDEERMMLNNTMFSITSGIDNNELRNIIEMIRLSQKMGHPQKATDKKTTHTK